MNRWIDGRLSTPIVTLLRAVLAAGVAGSLVLQGVLLAWLVTQRLFESPGSQRFQVALIGLLWLVAAQVVAAMVWRLLTMARNDTVFTAAAYRFVDIVIGAVALASGLAFWLGVVAAPGESVPPGVVLIIGGAGVALAGVALIVFVLRRLLVQAVARNAEVVRLQAELDAVI